VIQAFPLAMVAPKRGRSPKGRWIVAHRARRGCRGQWMRGGKRAATPQQGGRVATNPRGVPDREVEGILRRAVFLLDGEMQKLIGLNTALKKILQPTNTFLKVFSDLPQENA